MFQKLREPDVSALSGFAYLDPGIGARLMELIALGLSDPINAWYLPISSWLFIVLVVQGRDG